jgi:endoglucanase
MLHERPGTELSPWRGGVVVAVALAVACGGSRATGGSGAGGGVGSGAAGASAPAGGAGGAGGAAGEGAAAGAGGGAGGAPLDAAAGGPTPVELHGQLKVVGTALQDASGAPVQLKGVSSMWLNWESKPFAESKAALRYARDSWKLSVVRAAMGVDATGGYLTSATAQAAMQAKVDAIVGNAIDLGIYVIVDWHTSKAHTEQAAAVAFFTAMAQKYGAQPNVIWEPYNEPTGVTWATIKPYHEAVVAAIRAQDPDNPIVLGTPNWSQDVDVAAADPVAGTNLLYTLHFYACTHKQPFRDKGDLALSLGAALFVTEFGATPSDGGVVRSGDNNVCEGEASTWFAWMAQHGISGASWKLDQCTDSSCILTSAAPVDGPWTDDVLSSDGAGVAIDGGVKGGGHGQFVVGWIRQP